MYLLFLGSRFSWKYINSYIDKFEKIMMIYFLQKHDMSSSYLASKRYPCRCFPSWGTGGSLSWRSFSGKSGVVGRSSWIGEWSSEPWEAWLTVPTYCFTRTLYEPNFSGICAIYFDLKVSDSPFFRGKNTWIQNLLGFFWFGNQAEKNPPQNQGCFVFVFQIGLFCCVWIFHCWMFLLSICWTLRIMGPEKLRLGGLTKG